MLQDSKKFEMRGFGENDTNCGQKTGEMKSKNVREEVKYCEVEDKAKTIQHRIKF